MSELRQRPVRPEAATEDKAHQIYDALLLDMQNAITGMYAGLIFRGVEYLASSSALEFDSQMADVDTNALCAAMKKLFKVNVRCKVRSRSRTQVIVVCVPLEKDVKWTCFERMSFSQVVLILQTIIILMGVLYGAGYLAQHILHHDGPSAH